MIRSAEITAIAGSGPGSPSDANSCDRPYSIDDVAVRVSVYAYMTYLK